MPDNSLEPFYEDSIPSGAAAAKPVFDFQWAVKILLIRWKLIIAAPIVTLFLTYGILKLIPPVYKSTVEFLIFDPRQQVENVLLQKQGLTVDASAVAINTEIEVLRSKSVALRVVRELGLDKDEEFYRAPSSSGWFGSDSAGEAAGSRSDRLDRAADALLKNLQVQRVELSYSATLSVGSRSPAKAQRLAASVADNYLAIEREAREDALNRVEAWLRSRMQELQTRVRQSEIAIQDLAPKLGSGQISDLSSQLREARKLQELRKEAEANRKLYDSYLSQVNEISAHQPIQDNSARIITPATLPIAPSSPRRILFYGFGGIFGLGLGLLLAFGPELLRRGIKTEVEAERAFGVPVLGVVPLGQPARSPEHVEAGWLVHRVTEAPLSEIAEAVRQIRFRLTTSFADPGPSVILVTSALAGEGKSATAMLLAASYASSGQKTVIVDCDLRRHSLSNMFAPDQVGLTDILTGHVELAQALVHIPSAQIDLVTAGREPNEAADALSTQKMNQILVQLRKHYDTIVLDASPLLAVVDGLVMATIADQIVLVAEWSRTPRDAVGEALKALGRDVERVAGVVLNKADLRELHAYGYAYDRYTAPIAG